MNLANIRKPLLSSFNVVLGIFVFGTTKDHFFVSARVVENVKVRLQHCEGDKQRKPYTFFPVDEYV